METRQLELSNRLYIVAAVLVGAIVLSYIVGICVSVWNLPGNEPRYLTVNGVGRVFVAPDIAVVNFGITNSGTDTGALITKSNTVMNNIIQAVKGQGVDEKDIKTTQYSLSPRYEYNRDTGERIFAGYDMSQVINVKIRDFSKIGTILNSGTGNGANTVGDLYFTIDDPEKANQDAREEAVAEAKEKAKNIAESSGIRLGKLVNVSEGYYYQPMYKEALGMGGSLDAVSAPTPQIQPGQQEVNITMTLVYKIR